MADVSAVLQFPGIAIMGGKKKIQFAIQLLVFLTLFSIYNSVCSLAANLHLTCKMQRHFLLERCPPFFFLGHPSLWLLQLFVYTTVLLSDAVVL